MTEFFKKLSTYINNKALTTQEIYSLFPEMNFKTVSWHLNQELRMGNIERNKHGVYAITKAMPQADKRFKHISLLSKECYEKLKESYYDFYLSGLDCLSGLGFTVDGTYPILICTKKRQVKDIQIYLMRYFDLAITEEELIMLDMSIRNRIQFVILSSEDFSNQRDNFAFKEKAFVDLYYAITRMDYPLPIEELPHILDLIEPNAHRFKKATKDRNLSEELNFLLKYNKEFVKALVKYI